MYTNAPLRYFLSTIAALLAVACTLFVARVVLVIWKNFKKPIDKDDSPVVMSPLEIYENQKKIFK